MAEPSLGEVARQVSAERAKQRLGNVPLFTNDNLPSSQAGLGVIAASASAGQRVAIEHATRQESAEKHRLQVLRYDLDQAQQRLQLHGRELSVLEKELSQNKIQYYPDPNQTLLQEYSRQDVNRLADRIYRKRHQIAEDQQAVTNLEGELERAKARWGWLAAGLSAPAPPPITAKPGSPAYWKAQAARARNELATAKEQEKLAEDELKLLRIQQVRTLDPNVQVGLASAISAKEREVATGRDAVRQAQRKLYDVEQKMRAQGVLLPSGN